MRQANLTELEIPKRYRLQQNRIFTQKTQTHPSLRTYGVPRMWARPNATRPDGSAAPPLRAYCVYRYDPPPLHLACRVPVGKWIRNVHYTGLHTLAGRVFLPFTVTFPCVFFPLFFSFLKKGATERHKPPYHAL